MKKHLFPVVFVPLALFLSACGTSVPQDESPAFTEDPGAPAPVVSSDPDRIQVGQEPDSSDLIQEAATQNTLKQQKIVLLVEERLANAQAAYADGRHLDAANQLQMALDLDPTNAAAIALLRDVQAARGVAAADGSSDALSRAKARLAQLKADTHANAEAGLRQLDEGDYEGALGYLGLAKANIKSMAYDIEWGNLPAEVEAGLARAKREKELAAIASREEHQSQTFRTLQAEEAARRAQQERRLGMMLEEAINAFAHEDFDKAKSLTEDIIRLDPHNLRAAEVRDASMKTQYQLTSANFVDDRRERFRLWQEELEASRIPISEDFTAPDQDHWDRITGLREKYRNLGIESTSADSLENEALAHEIANQRIPGLRLDGVTDLAEVIEQLKNYSDINFVVHQSAIEAVDNESIEFNLTLGSEITVLNALRLITQAAGEEVVYMIDNGVVHLTTKDKAFGQVIITPHDIKDLTNQFTDFAGPRIDRIWLTEMDPNEEEEGSIYGGPFGEPRTLVNPDEIADLVMQVVAPGTWDDNTAEYAEGFLIVTHTPEVQWLVDDFLQGLRRYNASMVSIEARFLTIQKDYLREIGVDFRGLGGLPDANDLVNLDDVTSGLEDNASAGLDNNGSGLPVGADTNPSAGLFFDEAGRSQLRARTENMLPDYGTERMSTLGGLTMQFAFLDDAQTSMILRAVEKSNRAQELNSSSVMAQNTQRSFMTVLNQVTYIQDMDVEVAQAASVADPVVGVVSDGIVIDVRPIISHDRKYITLELQPTVATLLRPIPEFTSSLAGLTTPVTLQLPELFIASAKTNAIVPDGGTVVIAGLRKLLNVEQRSEIPFLAKIPILSALFKAEGEANENEDIIILIRAQILDTAEVMAEMDRRGSRRN